MYAQNTFSPSAAESLPAGTTAGRVLSKPCSKCQRVLPLEYFALSPPHRHGRYPSCKKCQKETTKQGLARHVFCSKCRTRPHRIGNSWCDHCRRISEGKGPKKFIRRPSINDGICPRCRTRPKMIKYGYCLICTRAAVRERSAKKRGIPLSPLVLAKKTTRHYVNTLFQRGKLRRGPCVYCGDPGQEFHHWDYLPRTLNIDDVCKECHVALHKILRLLLTAYRRMV